MNFVAILRRAHLPSLCGTAVLLFVGVLLVKRYMAAGVATIKTIFSYGDLLASKTFFVLLLTFRFRSQDFFAAQIFVLLSYVDVMCYALPSIDSELCLQCSFFFLVARGQGRCYALPSIAAIMSSGSGCTDSLPSLIFCDWSAILLLIFFSRLFEEVG